jgi:two-component system NtrC family sensor kinase
MGNLIGNAIKYTPAHGKLAVRGHAEEGQIIIQVSDNGPGIPATDQPYIFDKFYRGSNIPMDAPGTGLGLAIVKSIVDNHQGRIWVDSVVGQGTTFTVVLPVTEHEA